ncbi:MAG: VOC family protein [Candidatus Nanopelagicales bacterium]|nr:VOC family protein [Candidatus Nanopelagicales bacterium]
MTVYSISHININVADLDASVDFYVGRLGLTLVRRVSTDPVPEAADAPASLETAIINTGGRGVSLENIMYTAPADPAAAQAPRLGVTGLRLEIAGTSLGGSTLTDPDGVQVHVFEADRTRIAGARVHVADLEDTRAHWAGALGFEVHDAEAGSDHDAFVEVRSATDQFRIEFIVVGGPVASTNGTQLGARRLAFTVDDVQATYDRALLAGGRPLDAPARFELGPVRMIAGLWFDPSGVVLQGLQFIKDEPA